LQSNRFLIGLEIMSSWHISQLKFALGLGSIMTFYGVVGTITWLLGTKMGFPVSQRIVVVILIALTLPLALIGGYVISRRKKKKEEAEKAAKETGEKAGEKVEIDPKAQKVAPPAAVNDDLNKSAEEVVQFLKGSNLGEAGKDAVYSLPWYLVAGTPKSGKSSLVLGSNLNFQNLPSQRESEQKFIRPTRNIDWRVTSDAVFVDTAGRFQTEGADGEEWSALLETIKKYRSNRPLDGLLLVVSTEKILNSDERQIEEIAKIMRARLDEATQKIKLRFPVYLIFTNADSIEGFRDSFSISKKEGETLVWGATIPIEKSDNSQALFDGEYELLQNSVMKRRLMRLSAPFEPVRQLRIFNFPLHFGSARRKIGTFVSTLFRPNPFSESPFLRGFYFTAAPVASPRAGGGGAQTMPGAQQTVGQTFFTQRLFRDVILRDKDLVRTLQQQKQRPPILGWLLTFLVGFVVLFMLAMVLTSLITNKQMLEQTAVKKGEAVLNIVRNDSNNVNINPLDKKAEDKALELKAIDELRKFLLQLDDWERNGAPFYMRFGLYSGDRIYKEKLLPFYFNAIERRFKKPMVAKVEDDLSQFAKQPAVNLAQLSDEQREAQEKNLGKYYDLLKAYLMLTAEYKDRANAAELSNNLKEYWVKESKVGADDVALAEEQIEFWSKQVDRDEGDGRFPRIPLDKVLVDSVRKKLQSFPAPFRYYKRKVTEISKQVDEKIGATNVEGILSRNNADPSYMEGNYTIPGAYTLEGSQLMKKAIDAANVELSADDWVMGELDKKELTQKSDADTIQLRYLRDYADHWRSFVKGVRVKPYTDTNARAALESFTTKSSPMQVLAQEIVRNTNLSANQKPLGWWAWITDTVGGWFEKKEKLDTGGASPVEDEFRPLFTFVGESGNAKGAQIDEYQKHIDTVSRKFSGFEPSEIPQLSQELANNDDKKFQELRIANTKVAALLKPMSGTPLADLFSQPIGNLVSLLGAGAQNQLAQTWASKILPEAKKIETGFPFDDSQNEADINLLKTYLNPSDGILTKFYNESLKNDIENVNGVYKVKDAAKNKNYSDEFLTYLTNAFRLRDALFSDKKSSNPKYSYTFEIKTASDAMVEGTVDGQDVKSGEAKSLKFPADAGSAVGVNLKISSTTAATTPTPGNTSANTSTSNVSNTNTNTKSQYLQSNTSDSSNLVISKQTTWGLFRFFNDGSPQPQSGSYVLTYKPGGKTVTIVITTSGGDLFAKDAFKSVRAPQNLTK